MRGFVLARAEILDQYYKFVTTQAGHGVDSAHALQQALRHFLQQQVSDVVAEVVIELLEVIHV